MGKFIRKYIPRAKNFPTVDHLKDKYLQKVFVSHIDAIKTKIHDQKITLIIDESPDLMGRPALNILASFFDYETRQKRIVLLKTAITTSTNSVSISHNLSQVLGDFNKSSLLFVVILLNTCEN